MRRPTAEISALDVSGLEVSMVELSRLGLSALEAGRLARAGTTVGGKSTDPPTVGKAPALALGAWSGRGTPSIAVLATKGPSAGASATALSIAAFRCCSGEIGVAP
jgi:hypothetical protein